MEQVWEFLKNFNVQTLIGMFAMLWYFTYHLEKKLQVIEGKMLIVEEKILRQAERTDRLYEMFIDLLKEKK